MVDGSTMSYSHTHTQTYNVCLCTCTLYTYGDSDLRHQVTIQTAERTGFCNKMWIYIHNWDYHLYQAMDNKARCCYQVQLFKKRYRLDIGQEVRYILKLLLWFCVYLHKYYELISSMYAFTFFLLQH